MAGRSAARRPAASPSLGGPALAAAPSFVVPAFFAGWPGQSSSAPAPAWRVMRPATRVAVVPVSALVKLPEGVSFETAAAAMLQGMKAKHVAWPQFTQPEMTDLIAYLNSLRPKAAPRAE